MRLLLRESGPVLFMLFCGLQLMSCGGREETRPLSRTAMTGPLTIRYLCSPQGIDNNLPCNPSESHGLLSVLQRIEEERDDGLLLICGDLFQPEPRKSNTETQLVYDFHLDFHSKLYGLLNPTAVLPGKSDLMLGIDRLKGILARSGLKAVCANLVYKEDRSPVFPPYIVEERKGIKIGILGVLIHQVKVKIPSEKDEKGPRSEKVPLEEFFERDDLEILDPVATVAKVAGEMKASGVDYIVALSFLSPVKSKEILEQTPVDLTIGTVVSKEDCCRVVPGGVRLETDREAKGIGVFKFFFNGEGPCTLEDKGRIADIVTEKEEVQAAYDLLVRRYGTEDLETIRTLARGTDDAEAFVADQKRLQELADEEKRIDDRCRRAYFENTFLPTRGYVEAGAGTAGSVWKEFLDSMEGFLKEHGEVIRAEKEVRVQESWKVTDPKVCGSCHPEQYAHWKSTGHADAFQPVVEAGCIHYTKCLKCHTTGQGCFDGFLLPPPPEKFASVNCEACHGFSADHVADFLIPTSGRIQKADTQRLKKLCTICHEEDRSPGFKVRKSLFQVQCPPIDYRSSQMTGMIEKRSKEIDQAIAEGLDWEKGVRFLEAADIKRILGADDDSIIQILSKGFESHPGYRDLVYRLYPLLLRKKRFSEAFNVMETYLAENPEDEQVNREIIRLMIYSPDPKVRNFDLARKYIAWFMDNISEGLAEMPLHLAYMELLEGDVDNIKSHIQEARDLKPAPADMAWIRVLKSDLEKKKQP